MLSGGVPVGSERVEAHTDEPTVLLVAPGERFAHALSARLGERGLAVETAELSEVGKVAFAAAPDLVVLAGSAAVDGGLEVLAALAERAVTATLPVVLVTEERPSSPRLSAFRHGVVAVIERSASADEMARRIAELAYELPERSGETGGTLRHASVDELVDLFAASLRSGILAVRKDGGASAQILLRPDRPVEEAIAQLIDRLRPLVASEGDGALSYEFHESAPSRISSLDLSEDHDGGPSRLQGRRVLVIEQSAARSDRLGQELRSAGALVVVADGSGHGLELARDLTPEVVVVDGTGVEGWGIEALRQVRRDLWLRWASLLLVDSDKLWRDRRRPDIALLAGPIDAQLQQDRELSMRAIRGREVGTRLEVVGPFRTLRALAETRLGLRITVRHPRLVVEIDLADGLVAGASAREPHARRDLAEGPAALSALFGLSSGRVHVVRAEAPKSANVMAPLDDAIAAAAREEPVIPPSLPPPSLAPPAGAPPAAVPKEDLVGLVQRLEALLAHVRDAAGEDEAAHGPPPPASEKPAQSGEVPRPSELPPIDGDEVDTGLYAPEMMQRLRARMRRSSQRMVAVTAESESAAERPSEAEGGAASSAGDEDVEPRAANAPPKDAHEHRPLAKKTAGPSVPRPVPPPPPGGRIPPAALPPPSSRARRIARRAPTLTLGSVTGDEASTEPTGAKSKLPSEPKAAPSIDAPAAKAKMWSDAQAAPSIDPPAPEAKTPSEPKTPSSERTLEPAPTEASRPEDAVEPSPMLARALRSTDEQEAEAVTREPAPSESAPVAMRDEVAASEPSLEAELEARVAPAPSAVALPRRTGSGLRLKLALAVGPVVLALLGGGVWLSAREPGAEPITLPIQRHESGREERQPTETQPTETQPTEPAPGRGPPRPAPIAGQEVPPSAERSGSATPEPLVVGPAPGEPIEGRAEDFDLARLGITPAERPSSRRVLQATTTRRIRLANAARNRGELDAAEAGYRAVLALEDDNARATAGLARIRMERGDAGSAVLLAQRLVRLRPSYASNYVLLGDALLAGYNREAARRAFTAAVAIDPSWAPARERLVALEDAPAGP